MNVTDLKNQLTKKIYDKAEDIISQRATMLSALLKYEISVINTELAMRSDDHGYNFKFIPESYANGVVLSPVKTDNGSVSMTFSIPSHVFKNASDEEVEFFKTFVLSNAIAKLKRGN